MKFPNSSYNVLKSERGIGDARIKIIEYIGYIVTDIMATGKESEYLIYFDEFKKSFYAAIDDKVIAWSSDEIEEFISFLNRSGRIIKESMIFKKKNNHK